MSLMVLATVEFLVGRGRHQCDAARGVVDLGQRLLRAEHRQGAAAALA
jgi:hypothetical protein